MVLLDQDKHTISCITHTSKFVRIGQSNTNVRMLSQDIKLFLLVHIVICVRLLHQIVVL